MVRKQRKAKVSTSTQEIRGLKQAVELLRHRVQQLKVEQRCLGVQQHILARSCDLLHALRTGTVHQGWVAGQLDGWADQWLLEELPLLRDLGVPHNSSLASQLVQQLQQPRQQQQPQHASSDEARNDFVRMMEADSEPMSPAPAAAAVGGAAAGSGAGAGSGAALACEPAAAAAGAQYQWQLKQQVARDMLLQQNGFAALEARLTSGLLPRPPQQQLKQFQELAGQFASSSQPRSRTSSMTSAGDAAETAALRPAESGGGGSGSDGGAAAAAPPSASPPPTLDPAPTAPHMHLGEAGDYMGYLLNDVFTQPPNPGAADMTLEQFAEYHASYVRDLALHLALAEQQAPQFESTPAVAALPNTQQQPAPAQGLGPGYRESQAAGSGGSLNSSRDLMQQQQRPLTQDPQLQQVCGGDHSLLALRALNLRHCRVIMSLVMLHQGDLLNRLRVCNFSTLELTDGEDQAWQRTSWMVDRLQLRSDQQAALIAGDSLFKHLVGQLLAARQELQQQQRQQAALRLPTGRAVDLTEQDQLAKRLQVLVKKELFLMTCASSFVVGVLDVVQLAKSVVLMWPYLPQMMTIGPVVFEKYQKQQELEQQRRQQKQ